MRTLVVFVLFITSTNSWSKKCIDYENVANFMNTRNLVRESREHRRKYGREPEVQVGDLNQARVLAMRLPAFDDLGFGQPGTSGWKPYLARHPQNPLNGKNAGFEIRNEKGHARVRLDWDPQKGAHYNIEITPKKMGSSEETVKLAIRFPCHGRECTREEFASMGEKLFRQP
jgi:hypothetical protein